MTLTRRPRIMDEHDCETADSEKPLSHDELPFAAAMGLSPSELLALDITRCFCHGWTDGHIAPWEHAFRIAEERLGVVEGPLLVARVFSFMRVVLRERRRGLRYLAVGCSRICPDEEELMRALHGAACADEDRLGAAVAQLIGTSLPERTCTHVVAKSFGALFADHGALRPGAGEDGAAARRMLN